MTGVRLEAATAEDRFRAMFARHHPRIYGYAARRVGSTDASDIAAEVFTVAWRRLRRVPHEPETLPWLYGVARKVVANLERSQRRADRLTARHASPEYGVHSSGSPGVVAALDGLRQDDREILMLAAWEGLSPAAIGAVLGCSANAAVVRLHRARARLNTVLEGDI